MTYELKVERVVDPPRRLAMDTTSTTPDGQRLDTDVDITFEPVDGRIEHYLSRA